jgi:hypothetical protein
MVLKIKCITYLEYIFSLLFHFVVLEFFFAFIGLDYYITNNTFNDIVISILIKLYNITCACFFYSRLYFSNKKIVLSLKNPYLICTTLILMDLNIIKVGPYNTRTTKVIINAKKKPYSFNKLILFQLHLSFQNPKCSDTQTKATTFS